MAMNETVHEVPLCRWMVAKYHDWAWSGARVMPLEFVPQQ